MTYDTLISVIIPTHNRAHLIVNAIESVFAQSYSHWELWVVDDGSADATAEVVKALFAEAGKKGLKNSLELISLDKNQGVSHARNTAAKRARGSWLAFLDSDDEWLPEKLNWQIENTQKNPAITLHHGEETWIRKGVRVNPHKKHQKSGGDIFERSLELCLISPSAALIQKKAFWEHGGFREDFPVCEDYDLWLKHTSLFEVGFEKRPMVLKKGGHEDQLSARYKAMDWYRVWSMDWIRKHRNLTESQSLALKRVLRKKLKILIKGYEKHGHLNRAIKLKKEFAADLQDCSF